MMMPAHAPMVLENFRHWVSLSLLSLLTVSIVTTFSGCAGYTSAAKPSQSSQLGIAIGSLPSGALQTGYTATLTATGGVAPYSWSLIAGSLPLGLTISASGHISGTPTGVGTFSFTAQATDSSSPAQTASQSFSVTISSLPAPALTVTPTNVTFGTVNTGTVSSQSITLTNTGNVALSISQISMSGAAFILNATSTSATLSPAQSLMLNVGFSPLTSGTAAGTLTIVSNALGSPTNIVLSGAGAAQAQPYVLLDWTASASSMASGYNVYRSMVSGSGYVKVNASVVESLTYTDNAVQSGQTYYYVSTAVDSNGDESAYSNETQISVP
jgi:large repetitive protein